jgi:DUF2934 family protein
MSTTQTSPDKPTPEEIAALAYEIWEKGGCKPGTDLRNWLEAEKQLRTALPHSSSQTEPSETKRSDTTELGNAKANHLRRATNVRLQNHLASS